MKYLEYMKDIKDCPPEAALSLTDPVECFRYGKSNVIKPSDFYPPGIENPKRLFSKNSGSKQCSAYALSFFTSYELLCCHYQKLKKNSPGFKRSSVIRVTIDNADGRKAVPSDNGHFDLYESESSDLHAKAEIVGSLC